MTGSRHGRDSLHLYEISSASLIVAALLLFVAGRLALDYLPRFGLPACERPDGVFHAFRGCVAVLVLSGFGLQLRLRNNPSLLRLALATVVSLAALGVQEAADWHEAREQERCRSRTLPQATKVCQVDPAHLRLGKSKYGTPVLSLVSPGNTGAAWNCLQDWATYQNDVSLVIDEGVYRQRGD
ncbi:hypothetical protein K3148_03310 [Qipengyuania aurantiaca]|uniref:Uncharacterized protein n=1 Tax=Qipengyuania aurantiaca TaxID=2867233 RepID=A0ABX8ZRN9_9SPHN|nr:hypothetical protein [Qipengyuania aurantiaca]QZD90434.1 hypothetical protein K3148_03310 [Qipengyuania aurantiaca]